MAIGRLFYEMEQYTQASEAYSKVDRDSPEFDTMLYELAWVYVRLGDVDRAERALEVLMMSDPNSQYIGDGTLLRADLLLRAGAFDRALKLYEGVRTQYEPIRAKVDSFLGSTKDVSVYYDKLAEQQLDLLDQSQQLPRDGRALGPRGRGRPPGIRRHRRRQRSARSCSGSPPRSSTR